MNTWSGLYIVWLEEWLFSWSPGVRYNKLQLYILVFSLFQATARVCLVSLCAIDLQRRFNNVIATENCRNEMKNNKLTQQGVALQTAILCHWWQKEIPSYLSWALWLPCHSAVFQEGSSLLRSPKPWGSPHTASRWQCRYVDNLPALVVWSCDDIYMKDNWVIIIFTIVQCLYLCCW